MLLSRLVMQFLLIFVLHFRIYIFDFILKLKHYQCLLKRFLLAYFCSTLFFRFDLIFVGLFFLSLLCYTFCACVLIVIYCFMDSHCGVNQLYQSAYYNNMDCTMGCLHGNTSVNNYLLFLGNLENG